jgi:putative endonuclease
MPARTDARKTLGRRGEDLAARHLEKLGHEILARGARTPAGEVDLVSFANRTIVFVEVKTRQASALEAAPRNEPDPLAGIDARKRARVRRAGAAWLSTQPSRPFARQIRFDAIGILLDAAGRVRALEHVEDAF